MIEFEIDPIGRKISIKQKKVLKTIRGNGFYFLCLLMSQEFGAYATTAQVRQLPKWQKMQLASVGKQIARFIDTLIKNKIDIVEWANKTDGWRLKPIIAKSINSDLKLLAREAIQSADQSEPAIACYANYSEVVKWFIPATKSILAATRGETAKAEELIKQAYRETEDPFLCAVSTPVFTRIGQLKRKPHAQIPPEISRNIDLFELAIEARVAAFQAHRSQSSEWVQRYHDLERLHVKLRASGDFTSLAHVSQGLAVLAKRLGYRKKSEDFAKDTAALAFFTGDLIMMQSAAFNFGNILCENHRNGHIYINSKEYIELLELDIQLRDETSFGQNRAQSNIVLAYIHYLNNDFESADNQLNQAIEVISKSNLHVDKGLYYNVKGLLELKRAISFNLPQTEALNLLNAALKIYSESGNQLATNSLIKERDEILDALKGAT